MIDADKVVNVYSGRQGCMCGCLGKYSYASRYQADRQVAGAVADDEVSDRSVRVIVGKLNRNPNTKVEDGVAWEDVNGRRLAAYLTTEV